MPFRVFIEKPLREQKLDAAARKRLTNVNGELKKMQLEWKQILDDKFANHKIPSAKTIRCDSYTDVLNNWPKIEEYLDELRATRDDLTWPECLPVGIWSCKLCSDYVEKWKKEY